MSNMLENLLLVTGGLAALVLAMPSLAVLGYFFFVIPGLILSFAPTAFLWTLTFAVAWFAAKTVLGDGAVSLVAAAALTIGALHVAGLPNRLAGMKLYQASLLPDVTPKERLAMRGDIRVDVVRPRWDNVNNRGKRGPRGFACDNLCLALLFTPGVTSVTINKTGPTAAGFSLDPEARTYRLLPKAQCPDGGIDPDLEAHTGLFDDRIENHRALAAEWRRRLAEEVCLTRSALTERHDIVIRHGFENRAELARWSLAPAAPEIEFVEIQDGSGAALLRRWRSTAYVLTSPLNIAGFGGIHNFRFGWGVREVSNRNPAFALDLLAELAAHTDTAGKFVGEGR